MAQASCVRLTSPCNITSSAGNWCPPCLTGKGARHLRFTSSIVRCSVATSASAHLFNSCAIYFSSSSRDGCHEPTVRQGSRRNPSGGGEGPFIRQVVRTTVDKPGHSWKASIGNGLPAHEAKSFFPSF